MTAPTPREGDRPDRVAAQISSERMQELVTEHVTLAGMGAFARAVMLEMIPQLHAAILADASAAPVTGEPRVTFTVGDPDRCSVCGDIPTHHSIVYHARTVHHLVGDAVKLVPAAPPVAPVPEPGSDKAKSISAKLLAFARELGNAHPRYITLLNACVVLDAAASRAPGLSEERAQEIAREIKQARGLLPVDRAELALAAKAGAAAVSPDAGARPEEMEDDGHSEFSKMLDRVMQWDARYHRRSQDADTGMEMRAMYDQLLRAALPAPVPGVRLACGDTVRWDASVGIFERWREGRITNADSYWTEMLTGNDTGADFDAVKAYAAPFTSPAAARRSPGGP